MNIVSDREVMRRAMRRALEVARCGTAATSNPQVGCVLLDEHGTIVAEGWHRGLGTAHAEVDALSKIADARNLTAVVTLEPCRHTGHTGPCTDALIAAGVSRVVYACADTGEVSGGGAEELAAAGIETVLADRELLGDRLMDYAECLHREWKRREARPTIIVKWAQSLDGRTAASDRTSQWITGEAARADVHRRRAEADAIMVGTCTLILDDPSLTARDCDGRLLVPAAEQPMPIVAGETPIPADAQLRQHPRLLAEGLVEPIQISGRDLLNELAELKASGIDTVFVEGGSRLISGLIRENLVDEVLVYVAPTLLGGDGVVLDDIEVDTITQQRRLEVLERHQLGADVLVRCRFAPTGEGCECSQD